MISAREGMVFFAALVLAMVLYCLFFRLQDAKFAFLNLFRHKRRSLSTIIAIILGGVSIFR